jgi:hypothetical protein
MKTVEIKWMTSLDAEAVRDAMEDACVDCYGEDEQCSGLTEMVGQELAFPFPAKVLGETVEVVDTIGSRHDAFGLDFVVVHKGKRYAVAVQSVELLDPLPEGHLYLGALLEWKSRLSG